MSGEDLDPIEPPISLEVAGQQMRLFFDTESQTEALIVDIRAARQRIWIETFIFLDDRIGTVVANALKERAAEGLDVRLHYDAVGCLQAPGSFFAEMAAAGVKLHCFHSAWEALRRFSFFRTYSRRNHRKLIVIDDRVSYFGGMNIVDHTRETQSEPRKRSLTAIGWRDLHVRLEGTLVARLVESFERSWNRAQKRPTPAPSDQLPLSLLLKRDALVTQSAVGESNTSELSRDEWIRFCDSGLGPRADRAARVFTRLMRSAKARMMFSMAYFLPMGRVRRAMFRARRRGVSVQVIVPSFSDMPFVYRATRYFYDILLTRKFEVLERQHRMLHTKLLIVDEQYVVLGSSNFDIRSLWLNLEFMAVVRSPHLASVLQEVINRELEQCLPVNESFWRTQSWEQRLLDRMSWMLRPWL